LADFKIRRPYPRYGYVTSVVVKRPRFQLNRGRIFDNFNASVTCVFDLRSRARDHGFISPSPHPIPLTKEGSRKLFDAALSGNLAAAAA
jgi:hypothetical protein